MKLSRDRIKRSILGLATLSSLAVGVTAAVPGAHAASPQRHVHTFEHPDFYRCGSYQGAYWGYSYGYYHGSDVDGRLSDGYDDGDYWYRGYYPDDEYAYVFGSDTPKYVQYYDEGNDVTYRCFVPYRR
jgi:hypothetical protein